MTTLRPIPDGDTRAKIARRIRAEAADVAAHRPRTAQRNNGEADTALALADKTPDEWIAAHGTFTKGLEHDALGRVRGTDLTGLIQALNQDQGRAAGSEESPFPGVHGSGVAAEFDVLLFEGPHVRPAKPATNARTFESPISGHVFDLEGADPDAVGMPPAPVLGSDELVAEMAEVYGAALLRDVPFEAWPKTAGGIATAIAGLPFFTKGQTGEATKRRDARGPVTADTLFLGSTPGSKAGPYISQFMLIGGAERPSLAPGAPESTALSEATMFPPGSDASPLAARFVSSAICDAYGITGSVEPKDGFIRYGVQTIDQRFTGHLARFDHMTEWATWLDVQNGADRRGSFDRFAPKARFVATPRDLATYVHFDELEQAYRNAALLLLGSGQPFDRGLPEGSGHPTRNAFATFGGPHVLSLVSEVASRALKAVRRQKFNIHLRSRPEAVAAAISLAWTGGAAGASLGAQRSNIEEMCSQLQDSGLLEQVRDHNATNNADNWDDQYEGGVDLGPLTADTNALLPMAFPEGSPMHAAYGAGHATVAGACVTILKCFFEMFDLPKDTPQRGQMNIHDVVTAEDAAGKGGYPATCPAALFQTERSMTQAIPAVAPAIYQPDPTTDYTTLAVVEGQDLTIQGELDKLAANISIGRNFAGVHYYTDYYESVRLGERIAVALLQEQMLTYREPVSMRFTSFDGDRVMITGTGGSRDKNDALVCVWDTAGKGGTEAAAKDWWLRHR